MKTIYLQVLTTVRSLNHHFVYNIYCVGEIRPNSNMNGILEPYKWQEKPPISYLVLH